MIASESTHGDSKGEHVRDDAGKLPGWFSLQTVYECRRDIVMLSKWNSKRRALKFYFKCFGFPFSMKYSEKPLFFFNIDAFEFYSA